MAKTEKDTGQQQTQRGRGWEPLPTSPYQRSAFEAVGDDMPKDPVVRDDTQPAPGDQPRRSQTKSRSSKGGE